MSQTPISTTVLKQNNYAVAAGDLLLTMTAMDASNGNSFTATGREILLFQNTDSSAHTVTITSVADALGRSDSSLTSYSLSATPGLSAIQMKYLPGWLQANGSDFLATSSALVKVCVLQTN
jgi:hypothetical protein